MLRHLFTAGTILSGIALASATHAAALSAGDLIKLSSRPDIYYYGPDAKRYVFPNEKTYFTWYTDFSTKVVTDTELAAIPVGGAATYRPGFKLVKITTDPKVYAVSRGGTLRWIETEHIAAQLYGPDWNTKVDDLPDAFFATYKIGTSISSASAFSPTDERTLNPTIAADKQLVNTPSPTPPTPTPTPTPSTMSLQLSKTTVLAGDIVSISSSSTHSSGIAKIELFFDGTLIKTCQVSSCSGDVQIPLSGTKSTYEAKAISTALDTTTQLKTGTLTVDTGSSNLVTLTVGRAVVKPGQAAEAIVESDASIAAIRTDIFIDGTSIEACASSIRRCAWSDLLPGSVGTVYDVYGKVTDSLGRTYTTPHKTITVGTNDSPIVSIAPGKSLIYVNETVDVTVTGSDDNGIVKLEILKDGAVLKTCDSAAPCTLVTGPWTQSGTISFTGRATDGLGMVGTSDPTMISVTQPQ